MQNQKKLSPGQYQMHDNQDYQQEIQDQEEQHQQYIYHHYGFIKPQPFNKQQEILSFSMPHKDQWSQTISQCQCEKLKALKIANFRVKQNLKILKTKEFPALRQLILIGCLSKKYNRSNRVILKSIFDKNWPNLKHLHLDKNNIGSIGARQINAHFQQKLQILSINFCNIGEQGAKMLTKGGWGNLRTLAIQGNNLGFNGNLAIASMNTKSKKSDIRQKTGVQIWAGQKQYQHYFHLKQNISALIYVSIDLKIPPMKFKTRNVPIYEVINEIMNKRFGYFK